ncbi:MAG: hypothetical protein WCP22_06875 [Chlamydiota bacterium]
MKSDSLAQSKKLTRRESAGLSFDAKLAILIRLQETAREMARAAGRPFRGTVWKCGRRTS